MMQASTSMQDDMMENDEKTTQEKIFAAALALFAEHGYKATTTKAIAEKAGVNEVTLFRNYSNKENLFMELIKVEAEGKLKIVSHEFEPTGDLVEDLTQVGMWMNQNMYENSALLKILIVEVSNQPEIFEILGRIPFFAIERLSNFFEKYKEKGLVRKDVDTELAALAFFSFMFRSLISKAFIGNDVFIEMSEDTIRGLANLTVNGIGGGDLNARTE